MAKKVQIKKIKKRNGQVVPFRISKIKRAIWQAAKAAGGADRKQANQIASEVVKEMERRFNATLIPEVEQVQDLIEKSLLKKGHEKTYRAFILYRDLHAKMCDIRSLVDTDELIHNYLDESDWRVKENANMTYSLQGLNNHVASIVSANFWLNQIYPRDVRKAHSNGDLHIHDLALVSAYCAGWDLKDLLIKGFGGVSGKLNSKPPKHFATALGQLVNFFYTLQGEVAGAVAIANFDTYLAPFIRHDKLSYKQVKQAMQEFIYNMNVPTRVGFQCISEDTEILTPDGWKNYQEINKGSVIKTFNTDNKTIEDQKVDNVFKKKYQGKMYNLKNRIQDQLISPEHRVVRKKFQTNRYVLEPIEAVSELKSPVIVPVAGKNFNKSKKISTEQIKLMAWIIADGTIEKPGKYRSCYRISIYQSKHKNKENYQEIKKLLNHFNFRFSEYQHASLGLEVSRFRLNAESSKKIHKWFGTRENVHFIPEILLDMDKKQSLIFINTYLKADGSENCKISTANPELLDDLQRMIVNCEYGFTVLVRPPTIGKKVIYVVRIIKHKDTYIQEIKKIQYKGVIWSPHTKNETVIARRNGKVFITGNTPFTNVTLDMKPSKTVAKEAVIIGGKAIKAKYGDYQREIDLFNKAFAEVMLEGDAQGRVFTFPIPTYSVTKDFDWDNPELKPIWEMTRKYGIPYWANYVNSDMDPDDTRSMCPLAGFEKVLIRSKRGRGFEFSSIRNIYEGNSTTNNYKIYADGKFVPGKFSKYSNQKMIEVVLENGHKITQSIDHQNFVVTQKGSSRKIISGKDLKPGMYLPYSLNEYQGKGGDVDLGYLVGAFAGDGSFDRNKSVIFSLEKERKVRIIKKLEKIAKRYFGAHSTTFEHKSSKLFTLKVHSQAVVGLCRDYVEGKGRNKHYKARVFSTKVGFRRAVIQGHYDTDGGNRNRIYTSSKKMVETLNMLAATLGTSTSIYKDQREGRFSKEANYAVLIYQLNREKYGKFWFKQNGMLWVKVAKIIQKPKTTAYCFEVKGIEPIFTVGTTGILTHNCRLRIDNRVLRRRGGLFAANPLTGSIGVVTINMPRISFLSKNEKDFFGKLSNLMDLAKESLIIKRQAVEDFTKKGLYPYCQHYLSSVRDRFGEYWKNHFNTIGLLGMNEACLNILGNDITSEAGHKFSLKVMDFMRKRLLAYQKETGDLYNLEATPGEGTSYRFARLDREHYPQILVANKKGGNGFVPYYTNSSQLPVNHTDDIFEAMDLQDELQSKYTGGTVMHGFLGEAPGSVATVKKLIQKISSNYNMPYFTLTPTFSVCPQHGYIPGEHEYCPKCDDQIGYMQNKKIQIKKTRRT